MSTNRALAAAIRNRRQNEDYALRDGFAGTLAAGAVNGAWSVDGRGIRGAIDGNNKLSIGSGVANFATGGVANFDPSLVYQNQYPRVPGQILLATVNLTSGRCQFGWLAGPDLVAATINSNRRGCFDFNSTTLAIAPTTTGSITVGALALTTTYQCAIVQRNVGMMYFIKGGAFTNWTLLYIDEIGTSPLLNPFAAALGTTGVFTVDLISLPSVTHRNFLPVPLISDGFSSWGSSDGFGHQEGIAGALGAGGNGVAWNATTWTATGGLASNTPTKGANLLTDGALDAWTSATNLTNWTESLVGSSTVNQETVDVFSGSAARLATDASNNLAKISQSIVNSNGDLLLVTFRAKTNVAGRTVAADENNGTNAGQSLALTTSYVQYPSLLKATKANTDIGIKRVTGTSANIYVDDVSVQVVTLSTLRALASLSKADVLLTVAITYSAGLVGFMFSVDSTASPANFALALMSSTTLQVYKVVAGVLTPLSATAITYSAGAALIARKIGTEYRFFYNNAAVVTATIADAGIVSNTIHGVFSTDSSNQVDNFVGYVVGSGGEYSILDSF